MKKTYKRLTAALLCFIFLIAQQAWTVTLAEDDVLFDLDTGMTLLDNKNGTWTWSSDSGDSIQYIDWGNTADSRNLSSDQNALILHQDKTSAYQFRLNMDSGKSFSLTSGPVTVGLRFKIAADSYSGTIPTVKSRLVWGSYYAEPKNGNVAFPLSQSGEDTWHTLLYTIDAGAKTIKGTLDGEEISSLAISGTETSLSGFGIQLIAQNETGWNLQEAQTLNTPVTWTIDRYFVVSGSGETIDPGVEPSTEPTDEPSGETGTLLDIGSNMVWNGSDSSISQLGRIQHQYFNASLDPQFSHSVTQDKKFEITQSLSSGYQHRLLISDPKTITLDNTVTITVNFKLKASDYSNPPVARMSLVRLEPNNYYFFEMNNTNIDITQDKENTVHKMVYTIDASGTMTGTLDGTIVAQGTLPNQPSSVSDLALFPVVQPHGQTGTPSDATPLGTTVTWTIESINITKGEATEPEPDQDGTLLSIDNNMNLSGNMLSETGTIKYENYKQGSDSNASYNLVENGTQFQFSQSLPSAYQQRITVVDPASITLDKPVTITMKFKVKSDNYDAEDFVRMMFVRNESGNGFFLPMGTNIPLSADTEDVWQTLVYTIEPGGAVTGTLNGSIVATGTIPNSPATLTNLGIFPVAQAKGQDGNQDTGNLGSTITWTIDSLTITKGDATEPEPDQDGTLVSLDDNMSLAGNMLSEVGTVKYENYKQGSDSNASYGLIEDGTQFQFSQSLSSAYQQRITVVDPASITLNKPVTITMKFKIKSDNYAAEDFARIMFVRNESGNGYFLPMGTNIPLSSDTEDVWQTLVYMIEPGGAVTGTLNGTVVAEGVIGDKPETLTNIGLYPVAQAKGQDGNQDTGNLGSTITWTIDSLTITKSDSTEPGQDEDKGTPLAEPVSSGSWTSGLFADGVGNSERNQLNGKIMDLGELSQINKIVLDHDSSKIMSFSISVSTDGLTYNTISSTYPGGVEKYSGRQVYRFPAVSARYVKYNTVLIEDSETEGILNNMTASYTDLSDIEIANAPAVINPTERNEFQLKASASDADDTGYILNSQGVIWTLEEAPEGVTLNGATLTVPTDTPAGSIRISAKDAGYSADNTQGTQPEASAVIEVKPSVAFRNFALYSDENMSQPLTNLASGAKVYAKADIAANAQAADKSVSIYLIAYNEQGEAIAVTCNTAEATAEYTPISVSMTPPQEFSENGYVTAYLWYADTLLPISEPISVGLDTRLNAQNVCLPMHGSFQLSGITGDVTWKSDDTGVATVSDSGLVSSVNEGFTTISAWKDGTIVASANVQVKADTYVFLMLGQSNTSGTNNPVAEGVDVPISSNVKLLNDDGVFEQAEHPYRRYSGVNAIGTAPPYQGWSDKQTETGPQYGINMGYQFSENMAKAHPDVNIGLVVNSSSGANIITYEKGAEALVPAANGYVNTVERMQQALSGNAVFKGILWHQGESDQLDSTYVQHLRNLIYDLRTALNAPEVPLILGGLSENNRPAAIPHNMRVLAETSHIPMMAFVSSVSPSMIVSRAETEAYKNDPAVWHTDYTHFSAAGQIEFGNRYYQSYLNLLGQM
jgi:hypothetical protein